MFMFAQRLGVLVYDHVSKEGLIKTSYNGWDGFQFWAMVANQTNVTRRGIFVVCKFKEHIHARNGSNTWMWHLKS
jgi:hypothetical protein